MSNAPCETCDDSGYVWVDIHDGHASSTMVDCPNDECNAFGQLDTEEVSDAE